MNLLYSLKRFYFYRRYKWNPVDFETFQENVFGYPASLMRGLVQCSGPYNAGGVLKGFNYVSSSGLGIVWSDGIALGTQGELLSSQTVPLAVLANKKSLIVARPRIENDVDITRPMAPFDTVALDTIQTCDVVAIAGSGGNYPAKTSGDVILFGVVSNGSNITDVDHTMCELVGKFAELNTLRRAKYIVGNFRYATHRTLADAIAVAVPGDIIRVASPGGETLDTPIDINVSDIRIECDPNVQYDKGSATTGFIFSANGIGFSGGLINGFSAGGDKAISITADYCQVFGTRFSNNDSNVVDAHETSQLVGVISQ
jgi:hypothetical protein